MNTQQGCLITDEQYRTIREYEESARFDYAALARKYENPFRHNPADASDASADVVIAGGGPSGLMYSLYLIQRGFSVIVIEPQEIGYTTRDWNISLDELMHLRCMLTEEEIMGCISGRIVSQGNIQFKNLFTYRSTNVLDIIVDPEKFLKLLGSKIVAFQKRNKEEVFFKTRYDNFTIGSDRVFVSTADGRKVEAKLFLHGMGSQDEISWFANYGSPGTYYHAVGVNARIGDTFRPHGDLLDTIEDASYGPHTQQIIWQFFMSEAPHSDCATIYIFSMEREQASLVALMKYFADTVCRYLQADVIKVNKLLYGYIPLPDDMTGIKRSIFPRVYSIGECSINSVATGCGFCMCIKNLDTIGSQLVRALKKSERHQKSLSAFRLNQIIPDMRQLCSVSIEQLFKENVMRADNESIDKPNLHNARMFKLFSLIGDEKGRNDMLKSIIRPYLFMDALVKVRTETDITMSEFFDILKSNNRNLSQRLRLIAANYWKLLLCEIKQAFKHLVLALLSGRDHISKSRLHAGNVMKAHPLRFYAAHRFLKKRARHYREITAGE